MPPKKTARMMDVEPYPAFSSLGWPERKKSPTVLKSHCVMESVRKALRPRR